MPVTQERLRALRANNDLSHHETRACIKEALIALMQQKSYDEISMTDIIRKSGVSRSGVYKNYKCKDEIICDLYNEPVNDVISALGNSIFDNMEMIFIMGKKHESALRTMLKAGLEHNVLMLMNKRFEDASVSFYIPLWNGMIYNAFFRVGQDGDERTRGDGDSKGKGRA